MKLKNLLTTVVMFVAFALAVNSSTLAATIYVNNNGGVDARTGQNDNVLDNINGPVATITRAVELATDGDIISIAYTGVPYTEPGPPAGIALITKSVTLSVTGAGSNQLIIDKVTMNGASKTATFDGAFTIQTTLYLQAGTVGGGANITIGNGATIRRDAGSLASAPVFGASVNLQYDASANLGSEFPADATVANNLNVTAGTLTVNRAIQIKGALTNNGTIALGVNDFTFTSSAGVNHVVNGAITSSTGKLIFDAAAGAGAYTINVDRSNAGGMGIPGVVLQNAARTLQFGVTNLDDDLIITGDVVNSGPGTIAFTNTAFASPGDDQIFISGNLSNTSSGVVTFGQYDVVIQGSTGVTNSGSFAVADNAGLITFGNSTAGNDVTITGSVLNSGVITGTVDQVTRQTMATIAFGGSVAISGNVTNSPDIAVSTTNNAASIFQNAGNITFANVALTITGLTSNNSVRTTGTAGASATTTNLGNITFANVATNVVFTGGLTNSSSGFASPITSSGSILFSARAAGTVTVGTGASNKNIVNSSTNTGGNGLIDLTAASTGAATVNGSISLEGASGDGDIILGAGNLTALGISVTRNVSGAQVTVAADGGVNRTHTLGVFTMSASSATFSIGALTGGASAVSLSSLNITGGTAILGGGASVADVSVTGNVLATGGTLDFGTAVRNVNLNGLDINMAGVGFANSGNTTLVFNRGTSGQTFTSGVNVVWPGNFTVSNTFPVAPIFTFATGNFTVAGLVTFAANASTTNGIDLANGRLILTKAGLAFDNAEGYTGSSGVVSMQGTAAQVVKGVGGFYAIESNNAAGVTFGDGASGVVTHPITGTLYLTLGDVTTDATGGNESTIAFINSTTPPNIVRSAGSLNAVAATAFTNAVNVSYTGTGPITAGAELGGATDINNLSVFTAGGQTVTLAASEVINGTLTVNAGQTLALVANTLTQNGASIVANGNITSTTGKIVLNRTGGTTVTGAGQLPDIDVANGSLANVINGSAGLNQNAGGVGTGDLVLLGTGSLTATFSGGGPHVALLTVGTGALALGGNLVVADNMVVNAGTVNLGTSNLQFRGATNTISSGASFTGTGTLVANRTGAQALDAVAPGSAFTVGNFEVNLSANTDELTIAGTNAADMIIAGVLTVTRGDMLISAARSVTVTGGIVLADAANSIIAGAGTLISDANSTLTVTANADFTFTNFTVADSTTIGSNRKLTVTGTLAHTAGLLTLSTMDISVTGTGNFTRSGGTYASNGGYLDWAATGTFTEGTGFSVPNLKVSAALNPASNNQFVVRDNLYLNAATITHAVSGASRLTLGVAEGAVPTVTVVGAGNVDVVPAFAQGHANYVFTGATTPVVVDGDSRYWPSTPDTLAGDLTVNMTNNADKVRFDQSRTVNDTASLSLTRGVLSLNDNVVLTLASVMTINKNANATLTLDDDGDGSDGTGSLAAPSVNLVYAGTQSTGAEFTAPTVVNDLTVSSGTLTIDDNETIAGNLTANDNLVVTSNVVLTGALSIADGKSLTITGTLSTASDVAISGTGTIGGAGTFNFTGADGQTLTVPGGVVLGTIGLHMTGTNPKLNVVGGDLTLNSIIFDNGILNMGDNTLILPRPNGAAFSGLAYSRTAVSSTEVGHVVGKVQRHGVNGDGGAGVNGNFAFPVGTLEGDYRPVFINFTPTYVLGTEVDFIVEHVAESPEGTVNLPLPYPDYYWLIKTDPVSLSPTQRFDISVVGNGVPFDRFEDMIIERRQDGNVNNPWTMQGSLENYVNFLDIQGADTNVTVTTTSSLGGLVTVGSRFTLGIPGLPTVGYTVSGTVTYDNVFNTPLAGVIVTVAGKSDTTDASGIYSISEVENGTYTLSAASSHAWGGVNATDALGVLLHTISNPALTGLPLEGADVNNSGSANATDAQQILLRANGNITSFAKGDWVFGPAATLLVTVQDANVTGKNFKGLATGDVNRSYIPSALAKVEPSVANAVEGKIQINPTDMIEVPVKVASNMNVGAMTLAFTYPQDLVSFEAVSSKADELVVNNAEGKISIAWASLKAMDLKADDAIVTLKFKPTEQFKAGSKVNVELDNSVSEVADITGKVINATLKLAEVEGFVPAEFALKQNYPNPFNPATTIRYELPVAGVVNLTVYNTLGEVVTTLVNEVQEAGVYKLYWNASDLASGIYFYRIDVNAGEKSFTRTNKMILMK